MSINHAQQLIKFLNASPTCYHAVANLMQRLDGEGYERLREQEIWNIKRGGKYYVVRGDSALIAFRVPEKDFCGFMISASHSDSPTFKIRQNADVPSAGGTVRLSVEKYGGAVMRSWIDRPLSIAGRIFVRENGKIVRKRFCIDRDLLIIPGLAIHMNRAINDGVALKANVDMLPLFTMEKGDNIFNSFVADAAGVKFEDVLSTELYLYPRTKATLLGMKDEFIAAPRLDDLECVYCCTEGFIAAKESCSLPLLCVFNNEEVGSGTRQGAESTFMLDTIDRITSLMGMSCEERNSAIANSFMVSADNAHAIHPAHDEMADKNEYPVLNGGIVIKFNAAQKYTTDGLSTAVFKDICAKADVPVQMYSNRADIAGGSTLGNLSNKQISLAAVDVGLPQLAMHSCYELGGVRDVDLSIRALTEFYGMSFERKDDDSIDLY